MIRSITRLLNRQRLIRRIRGAGKDLEATGFRVRNLGAFLADLARSDIEHVVLHWPDSLDLQATPSVGDDAEEVLLLLDICARGPQGFARVAARHMANDGVPCRFYCSIGSRGFAFMRYPYYPPLMARRLLATRVRDPRGFYRLVGLAHIQSLVYHLLYAKAAGLCRTDEASERESLQPLLQRLQEEAEKATVSLPQPLTLGALHGWLVQHNSDMPYDLKVRWPLNAGWLGGLIEAEQQGLLAPVPGYHYFCVLALRADVLDAGLQAAALQRIGEKFAVREVIEVEPDMARNVAAQLRGGNWMEGRYGEELLPRIFLLCDDLEPVAPAERITDYPHLDNLNMLWKHQLRGELSEQAGKKMHGVHCSDNHAEALYMLRVLQRFGLTA
ncbi:hypothetical protein [Pseudomonas xionganensis]|uniref:Uncharacterized protein n=1 Tax=Pseudomonas xionganensis TaxID=2654845 RepID=A0A6I4KNW6_9PSED|nr:hypothetical protein [Pseudomonas xionganensis]MVW73995.1 hypothetical protein [Pseudomonas xionganensis]